MRKTTLVILLGISSTTVGFASWNYYSSPLSSGVNAETTAPVSLNVPMSTSSDSSTLVQVPLKASFDRSVAPVDGNRYTAAKLAIKQSVTSATTTPTTFNYRPASEEYRALAAQRIGLENTPQLQELAADPSPRVRDAALERFRQLEAEYEIEANIEREPGKAGQYLPAVLDTLDTETDPFVLKTGLDYLGQYGENDPQAKQTLEKLSQRPDLASSALVQIGELLHENYGLPPDQVTQLLLDSPSANQLLEEDLRNLSNILDDQSPDQSEVDTPHT